MPRDEDLVAQLADLKVADSLPFRPSRSPSYRHLQLSPIPRFLVRVYSPNSDGSTDENWAKSRDAALERRPPVGDAFQRADVQATAEEIAGHLWWSWEARHDNLVSWTSSVLYALQFIIYRHRSRKDGSPLEDIKLCIVDTQLLECGSFIRDMDLIEAFGAESPALPGLFALRTDGTHHFGEYLSQGALRIEGKCKIVSAQAMLDSGLASILPQLNFAADDQIQWASKVVELRQQLSLAEISPYIFSAEQADIAFNISALFGSHWRLPFLVSLLACFAGRLEDTIIDEILTKGNFSEDEYHTCHKMTVVPYQAMPELIRVIKIKHTIHLLHNRNIIQESLTNAGESIMRAMVHTAIMAHDTPGLDTADRKALVQRAREVKRLARVLEEWIGQEEKSSLGDLVEVRRPQ